MYLFSQAICFIGLIIFCLSLWDKKYKKIIDKQIISMIFFTIGNLLLKAYAGFAGCFIACLRNILYKFKVKQKYVLMITIFLALFYALFFVRKFISVLPIVSLIIYSIILIYSKKIINIKIGAIINASLNIIYDLYFLNFIGAFCDLIMLFNAFISIFNKNKKEKAL